MEAVMLVQMLQEEHLLWKSVGGEGRFPREKEFVLFFFWPCHMAWACGIFAP